MQALKVSSQ